MRLRVTDDDGNQVITTRTVNVTNRAPTAVIEGPTAAQRNTNITFKSTSSDVDGTITKPEWDIDNNWATNDGTGTQITKQFSAIGPKTIRLRVTDNSGAIDEDVHVVDIGGNTSPVALFSFTPTNPRTGDTVTFTSASTDPDDPDGTISKTEWDWESDGTYDNSGKVVPHAFPLPGAQDVTLRVTDKDGASHSLQKTVNVVNRAPTATIGMAPAAPVSLEPVTFTAVAIDPENLPIASFLWDFDNDGQFDDATGVSVPWTFDKKGVYPVKVKVTDSFGASATGTRSVNVANTLPRATFSYDPPSPNPRDVDHAHLDVGRPGRQHRQHRVGHRQRRRLRRRHNGEGDEELPDDG